MKMIFDILKSIETPADKSRFPLRWRPGYRCSMDLTRPGQQLKRIPALSGKDHFGQSRYCGFLAWSIMHEHNQSALTCYGFLQPGKRLLRRLGLDGFRIAVQAVPVV